MLVIGPVGGICVVGVVCVAEPVMPSITALTICTRSPGSTYCGGTPVGIVYGWAPDLSCYSTVTEGTPSVCLGLSPSPTIAASPCKVSDGKEPTESDEAPTEQVKLETSETEKPTELEVHKEEPSAVKEEPPAAPPTPPPPPAEPKTTETIEEKKPVQTETKTTETVGEKEPEETR
ncbi:hypothetical protein SADUNF_Sadunf19G0014900 [Salix dunnii]|uniref:Uncharacterized protein n=1 Tax=Salix dunnii TaxID=1413687 RepID=A0A835J0U6_9ROSI|nr:hypothetical protein SADUNF_Sadunf19G0014900 [Salix dunnii]